MSISSDLQALDTAYAENDAVDRWWARPEEVLDDVTAETLALAADHDLALPAVIMVNALDVAGLDPEAYQRVIDAIQAQAQAWRLGYEG